MALTDVRDVATAHVRALTYRSAPGNRLICSNKVDWFQKIQAKFAKASGSKPAKTVPTCCFGCLALILPEAKSVKNALDKKFQVDAADTKNVLMMDFINEETTIND